MEYKKVALVTGAYKGLGFEWCRQLAAMGYRVVLTARNPQQAEEAASALNKDTTLVLGKALGVTDETQLAGLAAWVKEEFGHIDLIVNNAGVNPKDYTDKSRMAAAFYLDQLTAAEMLEVIHINSIAPLLVVKHFRTLLAASPAPVVINISSWLGSVSQLGFGGHYGYVGSKNLLNVLNKSMAAEIRKDNIISVNVNPGWVQTDMGGPKAQFTTTQAVAQLIENVLLKLTPQHSGLFLNYDGSEHPW
ncbi:MAG: SDR family oxidoreductase [Bacteroidia bacterium]|jgi:NAD(P)-dependent dehydrogenase (short-subunit alcohol dehydrogenase family)|nr:SDR family oxidoreductase [Bacteroidia bacterium]